MAKAIHSMILVFGEREVSHFYHRAFGLGIADIFEFANFTLIPILMTELAATRGPKLPINERAVSVRRHLGTLFPQVAHSRARTNAGVNAGRCQ